MGDFIGRDYSLQHHGILGQKWGVRRFQNTDGSLTSAGKKRVDSNAASKSDTSKSESSKQFVSEKGKKKISDLSAGSAETDTLIAYTAVSVAYVALMYGAAKISAAKSKKNMSNEFDELNKNKDVKSFTELKRLKTKETPEQSVKHINPDYPDEGTTMNCAFCTTAMALRAKGYDVKASKSDHGWYTDDLFKKSFNAEEQKIKAKKGDQIITELSKNGDGAYGNLTVYWKYGGAHSIFWKNEGGTTNIYDGQSGKKLTDTAYDKSVLFNSINTKSTRYCRLDDKEPTEYALSTIAKREED